MRLEAITIKNFRSIREAFRVPLSDMTVLVGPNNVGKSNVLRALIIALRALIDAAPPTHMHYTPGLATPRFPSNRVRGEYGYEWERDFPVELQEATESGSSTFVLEFGLSEIEEEEFKHEVGSKVKTPLPIEVVIGASGPAKISVRKRGRGAKVVTQKKVAIARFIAARFDVDYIPAVRTAESTAEVINRLVARELSALEEDPKYQALVDKIADFQKPILDKLAKSVSDSLVEFLPSVKGVLIELSHRRQLSTTKPEIIVDDGTATELRYKGDGVQSLATVAVLRYAASKQRASAQPMLVLEEPESHLHPKAIREFHEVLRALTTKQQVVVSTHCGLFVDRETVSRNVIVADGKAVPAKRIEQIREVLGIQASDNLQHAELVLVVEGEDDRIAMRAILADRSAVLATALRTNRLAIDTLGGAGKLVYKVGLLRNGLSSYVCFLDYDKAAREAVAAAEAERYVDQSNVHYTRLGQHDSEFEDLLDDAFVEGLLVEKYGVASMKVAPAHQKKKWSDRLHEVFRSTGKDWDDATEAKVKLELAEAISAAPKTALRASTTGPIDNLIAVLEHRLSRTPAPTKSRANGTVPPLP